MKENKICSVDGCEKVVRTKGMCNAHYLRVLRYGDIHHGEVPEKCTIAGCNRSHSAKGYCHMHYKRALRNGKPDTVREMHGKTKDPLYPVWRAMVDRCRNPNTSYFYRYGGRGIDVCNRWRSSFSAFLEDMGPRPTPYHQIDRIDNDGNYEPNNCQWLTSAENNQKKPCIKLNKKKVFMIRKSHLTIRDLSKKYSVSESSIRAVIRGTTWGNV